MEIVAFAAFAGVVVFGVLFIVLGLKGGPWKLPGIGMIVCFALLIVSVVLFTKGADEPTADQGGGISADTGLFNVTLTIPADFVEEGMTQEQLDESAKEGNFKSATLNTDGSVTYVITKAQHREMMQGIKQSIDDALAEMADDEDTPNIVKVEANGDYTQYKVTLKTDEVGLTEAFMPLALYFYSGMYHAFNGTQPDNVNIQYINQATGEVIEEANSKDLGSDATDAPGGASVGPAEGAANANKSEYSVGDTWTVDGQWELTITGVTETQDRNEFSDKNPGAVYIIDYTYTNLGYEQNYSNGLFFSIDDTIVDSAGKMGTSYPGNYTKHAQETPIGATCDAQTCIGVDNPGDFKLTVTKYDGNEIRQSAVFNVTVG